MQKIQIDELSSRFPKNNYDGTPFSLTEKSGISH